MLDPADCGPAFLGLCQDTQAEAFDYPVRFFEPRVHRIPRPRADVEQLKQAAQLLKTAKKPLIIAGGGVRWSDAEPLLASFADKHNIPVGETLNGRTVLLHDHPMNAGPIGIMGASSANELAAEADVVLAVGTRLQDFTTGSWTLFPPDARFIGLNTARFDAVKHQSLAVVGDARVSLEELGAALGDWAAPASWRKHSQALYAKWNDYIDQRSGPTNAELPTYAHVVGAVNRLAGERDLALTAAGGMPGELLMNWKAKGVGTFDCEFGFSCMGYEIAGGWGAAMADPSRETFVMVGDGSYMMMNSDIYSSVLSGHKLIVVVCDNGGFLVIDRLQRAKGVPSFNNSLDTCRTANGAFRVDFARHAESMGAIGVTVKSIGDLEEAVRAAKQADRTTVIHIAIHPTDWSGNDNSWWECGTPEVSEREAVKAARHDHVMGKKKQRVGV
jgi:3D-(3,5/4)-trihydroxycyclohexane-1,2-dione acylhydrolase (decyclizing)